MQVFYVDYFVVSLRQPYDVGTIRGPCSFFKAYSLPELVFSKLLFPFLQFTLIPSGFCLFLIVRTAVVSYSLLNIDYQLNDANCSHLVLTFTLFHEEKQTERIICFKSHNCKWLTCDLNPDPATSRIQAINPYNIYCL